MLRNAILVGFLIGTSVSLPLIFQAYTDGGQSLSASEANGVTAGPRSAMAISAPAQPSGGRKFTIDVDKSGHYFGTFKLNGRKIDALIDTGASAVAINLSTARKLGLSIRVSDMKHMVTTANGKTRATVAMIDRIEVGRIAIDQVQAIVLEDQALSTTLIGMTFLNRLKAFKVDAGTLTLVQ